MAVSFYIVNKLLFIPKKKCLGFFNKRAVGTDPTAFCFYGIYETDS